MGQQVWLPALGTHRNVVVIFKVVRLALLYSQSVALVAADQTARITKMLVSVLFFLDLLFYLVAKSHNQLNGCWLTFYLGFSLFVSMGILFSWPALFGFSFKLGDLLVHQFLELFGFALLFILDF
jgi:hypothetical protein